MNTEQIIKALECCGGEQKLCRNCPYNCGTRYCMVVVREDALSLIKELQAHNENLLKENKYLRERLVEEMEHKEDMVVVRTSRSGGKTAQLNKVIHIKKDEIIADTVKKMRERLHSTMCDIPTKYCTRTDYSLYYRLDDWVDDIAKEILEGGDTE